VAEKAYRLPPEAFFLNMKKTSPTQNETPLEAVVTAYAKREAKRLGIELSTYVATIAAKADRLPMSIQVRMDDIAKIGKIAPGGKVREWIEGVVEDCLECELEEAEELAAKN